VRIVFSDQASVDLRRRRGARKNTPLLGDDAMDERREELLSRKLNQLTAVLVTSVAGLVLLIGLVGIVLHGRIRGSSDPSRLADLERRVAELERAAKARPPAPATQPSSRPPSEAVPPVPATSPAESSDGTVSPAEADPPSLLATALSQARAALETGDLDAVRGALDRGQAAEPDHPEVLLLHAHWLLAQGRFADCVQTALRLLDRSPGEADRLLALAGDLLKADRPGEAVLLCDRLVESHPARAEAWALAGAARLRLLHPQEALDRLVRAVELDPSQALVWLHVGIASANLDDCDAALGSFDRALERDPNLADAHFARAACLARVGRLKDARASLNRAMELNPELSAAAARVPGLLPKAAASQPSSRNVD